MITLIMINPLSIKIKNISNLLALEILETVICFYY